MRPCEKCGSVHISGPFYKRSMGTEWLDYRCACGFTWSEPTHDSKKYRPPNVRPQRAESK